MALTKSFSAAAILLSVALLLAGGRTVQAQELRAEGPGQLGAEIQGLEHKLAAATISAAERHDALARLAQLRQLSGNLAGAAANWLDATAADPRDDESLVAGAYCLAAIGEWEKAASTLRPFLVSDKWGPSMLQAHYLDACLKAWTGNDASALVTLCTRPEFAALRPMIYYTLWQIITRKPGICEAGNAGSWKTRLLDEFPKSPEALAAEPSSQKGSLAVNAVQSPLWLLFPGASVSAAPAKPETPPQTVPPPPPPPKTTNTVSTSAVVVQTGVFSKEANAQAQSAALRKAGYTPTIARKLVDGKELWAVTVPPGQDTNKTIAALKKAGFDSFPVK